MVNFKKLFEKNYRTYKELAEKAFSDLNENDFFWQYNVESNSIAIIVKHLSGNLVSRFTHFLHEDGEKSWRRRDQEFINDFSNKDEVIAVWEKGWQCLFEALSQLQKNDWEKTIFIRGEAHTVLEALMRSLAHAAHHVGQIIYIAKMIKGKEWKTLSISHSASEASHDKESISAREELKENSSPVCYINSPEIRDDYKI